MGLRVGEPIPLGRACGRCGEQIVLSVQTDGGVYTDDLAAIFQAQPRDVLVLEAECGCSPPRTVTLEAGRS